MYSAIKSLYSHPIACIRLNNYHSDWFEMTSGVKQGNSLSPTHSCLYIIDLTAEITQHQLDIHVGSGMEFI